MMNHKTRFREREQQIGMVLGAGIAAAFHLVTAFSAGEEGLAWWFDILFALAWAVIGIRGARMGVVVLDQGVSIRNLFSGYFVKWSDIESFGYGKLRVFGYPVVVVQLKDGSVLPIGTYFILATNSRAMHRSQRAIDGLSAELGRRMGTQP